MQKLNSFRLVLIVFLVPLFYLSCDNNRLKNKSLDPQSSTKLSHQKLDSTFHLDCKHIGEINFEDNPKSLVNKFKAEQISTDSLFLEGMFQEVITIIDLGKPTEIKIRWNENNQIKIIEIEHPQSPYRFSNGLKIGSTLKDLVTINKKEISFYGFGWDYGGTISGFNNGTIQEDLPCFGGVLTRKSNEQSDFKKLSGDRIFKSDSPDVNAQQIYLSKIRISLNR